MKTLIKYLAVALISGYVGYLIAVVRIAAQMPGMN